MQTAPSKRKGHIVPTINGPPQESIPSDESMAAGPQAHRNTEAHRGKDLFNALVPVKAWVQDKQLRSPVVGLLVILTVIPCSASRLASHNWRAGAWVFAEYFAVAWLLLLTSSFARREPFHRGRWHWSQLLVTWRTAMVISIEKLSTRALEQHFHDHFFDGR